jgi:hypothetical protein
MIPGICIRWYRLENFNVWGCQSFSALCVITSAIAIASEFGLRLARGTGGIPKQFFLRRASARFWANSFRTGRWQQEMTRLGKPAFLGAYPVTRLGIGCLVGNRSIRRNYPSDDGWLSNGALPVPSRR